MGKKCIEEFNPWPPFVDIFSSVILVMLLFLLITLVNLGYYAQFKFKMTYAGSVSTDNLVLTNDSAIVKQIKRVEKVDPNMRKIQVLEEQAKKDEEIIQKLKVEIFNTKEKTEENRNIIENLELAGRKFYEQVDDNQTSEQIILKEGGRLILTFANDEIVIDDSSIKELKKFIAEVKKKNQKHTISISAHDPQNQVSSTISKQISLARTLNARNLIRKLDYKKQDVRINLLNSEDIEGTFSKEYGYLIVDVMNGK